MTQDDTPAPAVVDEVNVVPVEEIVVPFEETALSAEVYAVPVEETAIIEYVPPSSPSPAPKPAKAAKPLKAAAPDPFAVGVRVLKMAPAWLLFTAVCCSVLVLLLGWVKSSGEAEAVALPAKRNDALAAKPAPAAEETAARAEASAPAIAPASNASAPKSTAANDAPAQAVSTPAPVAPAPVEAPKVEEKVKVETPAPVDAGGGNFTAQVGSHSDQSQANEQVSRLRAAGFDARAVAAALPGRGTWYRVQVGRFADRGEAAKTAADLRSKGAAANALVVPVGK